MKLSKLVKVKKWIPLYIIILLILMFGKRLNSPKGNALYFNGENWYEVLPPYISNLDSGVIELAFSYYNKQQRTLFSTSSSTSSTNNYSLNIADGKIQYYDRYNKILINTNTQLVPGLFYDLTISYKFGEIQIFINGKLQELSIVYQGQSRNIGWFTHVLNNNKDVFYTLGAFKRPDQVKKFLLVI